MQVKDTFLFILCCGLTCFCYAQNPINSIPQTYTAYKTPEIINIDGEAEDTAWNEVGWTNLFIDIEGEKQPKYKTQVKMLWDDTHFYVLARMEEPHVWGNITKRDTIIYYNNDFEVFIDPDGDTHNYYELEINALNTVWDLFLTKPYREINTVINDWDIKNLKSAVKINGTLNNAKDIDSGWVLELAIPWEAFKTRFFQNGAPSDMFWRINFSRVQWEFQINNGQYSRKQNPNGKFLPEYNWVWSPMGVVNMHEPEKWGYVYFSSELPKKTNSFSIPQDEKIKWALYKMYRIQNAQFKATQSYYTEILSVNPSELIIDGKLIEPDLENHSTGWNISVKSPFTNHILTIREDGKFISN